MAENQDCVTALQELIAALADAKRARYTEDSPFDEAMREARVRRALDKIETFIQGTKGTCISPALYVTRDADGQPARYGGVYEQNRKAKKRTPRS